MSESNNKNTGLTSVIVIVIILVILAIPSIYLFIIKSDLETQLAELRNENESPQAKLAEYPTLVPQFTREDYSSTGTDRYTIFFGSMKNTGIYTAYNCKLHFVLYRGSSV